MSSNSLASALVAARSRCGPARNDVAAPVEDESARLSYAEALRVAIRRSVTSSEDVAAGRLLLAVPSIDDPEGRMRWRAALRPTRIG